MATRVSVLYFASLRDATGVASESLETDAPDLRALYETLRAHHGFALPAGRLRVAVNGQFATWDAAPRADDEIAFIPPVSGG